MKTSYYEVLGVNKAATTEEIKKAYHTSVKQYHPDINASANASLFFRMIKEAYDVLSNPQKRADYDYNLANPAAAQQSDDTAHTQDTYKQPNPVQSENPFGPPVYCYPKNFWQKYAVIKRHSLPVKLLLYLLKFFLALVYCVTKVIELFVHLVTAAAAILGGISILSGLASFLFAWIRQEHFSWNLCYSLIPVGIGALVPTCSGFILFAMMRINIFLEDKITAPVY